MSLRISGLIRPFIGIRIFLPKEGRKGGEGEESPTAGGPVVGGQSPLLEKGGRGGKKRKRKVLFRDLPVSPDGFPPSGKRREREGQNGHPSAPPWCSAAEYEEEEEGERGFLARATGPPLPSLSPRGGGENGKNRWRSSLLKM